MGMTAILFIDAERFEQIDNMPSTEGPMEIDQEIFSTVILSLPLIQEGQLSVSGERMCTILVNHLEIRHKPAIQGINFVDRSKVSLESSFDQLARHEVPDAVDKAVKLQLDK